MSLDQHLITRREAILRVSALLGGITFVGGSALLTACERERTAVAAGGSVGEFSADDIALLDEVAETILPETNTPGAKAAKTGAFMALMVTDTYDRREQRIFRDGMRTLDEESRKATNVPFMSATPQQRLALLERIDREQKRHSEAREAAARRARGLAPIEKPAEARTGEAQLPGQRQEGALGADVGAATAITTDTPAHYFRMMKELALLGYFTSEIGCTQAQRYVESPGRFDPCVPYKPGEKAWAPHA
ncbi:MAG: gluconate 2-dehydrogenase subunit 3 family protein [Gemmatimonadaceae bacterium]